MTTLTTGFSARTMRPAAWRTPRASAGGSTATCPASGAETWRTAARFTSVQEWSSTLSVTLSKNAQIAMRAGRRRLEGACRIGPCRPYAIACRNERTAARLADTDHTACSNGWSSRPDATIYEAQPTAMTTPDRRANPPPPDPATRRRRRKRHLTCRRAGRRSSACGLPVRFRRQGTDRCGG
jgi:hypothetical protein